MNEVLISIIIPVYNTEKYLKDCIKSAINQSYKNLEIIIVNDGSTDGSEKIIKEFMILDNRIKYFYKNNGGLSSARNYGINNSSGNYLVFLDSDDYLDLDFVKIMLDTAINNNVDIVSCLPNRNGESETTLKSIQVLDKNDAIKSYLKGEKYFLESCCVKLYKKSLFNSINFPVGKIHEDTFTTYKLLNLSNKIAFAEYKGYIVNERPFSITRSPYSDKNYDVVIANQEIYNYYKDNKLFSQLAYNKYLGSILYFILKSNNLNIKSNKQAYADLDSLLKIKKRKKLKFYTFIFLHKIKLLKYISL